MEILYHNAFYKANKFFRFNWSSMACGSGRVSSGRNVGIFMDLNEAVRLGPHYVTHAVGTQEPAPATAVEHRTQRNLHIGTYLAVSTAECNIWVPMKLVCHYISAHWFVFHKDNMWSEVLLFQEGQEYRTPKWNESRSKRAVTRRRQAAAARCPPAINNW